MSELSLEQIDDLISRFSRYEYDDDESGWYDFKYYYTEPQYVKGLGTVTQQDEYGGEGDGDQYWVVVKIDMEDGTGTRYFKKPGWYASHDGGYLDGDLFEVTPQKKEITVYE